MSSALAERSGSCMIMTDDEPDQGNGIACDGLQRHAEQITNAVDVLVDARRQLAGSACR